MLKYSDNNETEQFDLVNPTLDIFSATHFGIVIMTQCGVVDTDQHQFFCEFRT